MRSNAWQVPQQVFIVLALGWASQVLAATVTIATAGKAAATIVIPANSPERIAAAGKDLQTYIQRICGVAIPINGDGKRVGGCGLYIGNCEATTEGDLPAAELNPESYAIRVRDGSIFFTGRWPTPCCFAVYSFLEDNLGVRWFAPGGLWEFVPEGRPGELTVEVSDVVKVPSTSPRLWSGHQWFDSWKTWNLRNKTAQGEVIPRRQFQNNLYRVFPPEKYGETHPEYFPLIDGKRWIPQPGDVYWRPCESNPDVLRLTVEYARKWFDEHPTTDSFSLGMDDISHLCGCPDCRAMDPRPDSYEKREFSDRHYKFVNAVAREIAKSHPDRYIGTLIYAIARVPPETVPKLEDNVFGYITQTCGLWWVPGRREADQAVSREWRTRCKHLSRYDYIGFGTMTPRVFPHLLDEALKFDKSLGFEGMYTEVYAFLPNTAPMLWALAKLQWDHTLNVDDLLGEFYAKMYGSAAATMKRYFDLLERSYCTERPEHGGWEHRKLRVQATALSVEDLDEAFRLLQEAEGATTDPNAQQRIRVHWAGLQYGAYVIRAYALSQRLTQMPVRDEASAEEALRLSRRLGELSAEREQFWAEAMKRDDLVGESVRGLAGHGYLMTGQVASVEGGAVSAALKVLGWYARHAPERLDTVSQALTLANTGPVAEAVRAWLWVQKTKPASLLTNGDFESGKPNTERPEMDWRTAGAPVGWSVWSSRPETRFEVLEGKGLDGSAAASIAGSQSACYLQRIAARPGERYLVVAWVRGDPPGLTTGGKLTVRFQTQDGGWHARRDLEPSINMVEGQEDWQPLILTVTVPESAASLVIMPGALNQAEGARAVFDDVQAYRLPAGL